MNIFDGHDRDWNHNPLLLVFAESGYFLFLWFFMGPSDKPTQILFEFVNFARKITVSNQF